MKKKVIKLLAIIYMILGYVFSMGWVIMNNATYLFGNPYSFFITIPSVYFYFSYDLKKAVILGFVGFLIFLLCSIFTFLVKPYLGSDIYYVESINYSPEMTLNGFLLSMGVTFAMAIIHLLSLKEIRKQEKSDYSTLKEKILEMSTQFSSITIKELSQECNVEKSLVRSTIYEMIKKREVFAEYFASSKRIAFDQQANIDELDNLISKYKEWEEGLIAKK